jgi:uncharacterized membrane protein
LLARGSSVDGRLERSGLGSTRARSNSIDEDRHRFNLPEIRSGPLPSPRDLHEFKAAYAKAPRIIFEDFHEQAKHRRNLEAKVVESRIHAEKYGQWMAFVLCLVATVGGLILVGLGRSLEGFATLLMSLGSIAGIFVWQSRKQASELRDKKHRSDRMLSGEPVEEVDR